MQFSPQFPIAPDRTSHAFKFYAAVVEFDMLLRGSEFKADSSHRDVLAPARGGPILMEIKPNSSTW